MYFVCGGGSDSIKDHVQFFEPTVMCYLLFFIVLFISFILSLDFFFFFFAADFPKVLNVICSKLFCSLKLLGNNA